ncbi:MAG: hypothetical protein EXS67_00610 [Candidatus Margulisbacteria bacterium]|nr:hypothetical protein [Candidatus Margulisiibacteriota bacterium]
MLTQKEKDIADLKKHIDALSPDELKEFKKWHNARVEKEAEVARIEAQDAERRSHPGTVPAAFLQNVLQIKSIGT